MGWNSAPPINPPEETRTICDHCEGVGTLWTTGPADQINEIWCRECDGEGFIEPSDSGPDTWKEAEGIA